MIERVDLTDSQHEGYARFQDEKAIQSSREARFLAACLREHGKSLDPKEGWQFDHGQICFYRIVPDAPTDQRSEVPVREAVANG